MIGINHPLFEHKGWAGGCARTMSVSRARQLTGLQRLDTSLELSFRSGAYGVVRLPALRASAQGSDTTPAHR